MIFSGSVTVTKENQQKKPYDFIAAPWVASENFPRLERKPLHKPYPVQNSWWLARIQGEAFDVLHTLGLGVSARLAGSILHAWAFPPGSKKEDGAGSAAKVWAMLKESYAELGIKEKFNNLVVSMFTK